MIPRDRARRLAARFTPTLTGGLALGVIALGVIALSVVACGPSPTASPVPPTVAPTVVPATPAPTIAASEGATPAALADGLVSAEIPAAGIALPVPADWEQLDATALGDEAVRADVAARYPGMGAFLEAAATLGDRATPAFLALDRSAAESDVALAPSVSVLVAQPPVSGPLLDFVAGFIADAFAETFGSGEPERSRIETPVGEAVRLSFQLPPDGETPMGATAWVIGADEGTLLVTVVGPAGSPPASDPDVLVDGVRPLP